MNFFFYLALVLVSLPPYVIIAISPNQTSSQRLSSLIVYACFNFGFIALFAYLSGNI